MHIYRSIQRESPLDGGDRANLRYINGYTIHKHTKRGWEGKGRVHTDTATLFFC